MAAWTLTDQEWEALDDVRFSTTDATVFRNATIILMSAVGRSKFSIAHDLGCSPATVDNVRKRYRERGPRQGERIKSSPLSRRRPRFPQENRGPRRQLCVCGRCCLSADAA